MNAVGEQNDLRFQIDKPRFSIRLRGDEIRNSAKLLKPTDFEVLLDNPTPEVVASYAGLGTPDPALSRRFRPPTQTLSHTLNCMEDASQTGSRSERGNAGAIDESTP